MHPISIGCGMVGAQAENYHLTAQKIVIETLKDVATQTKLLDFYKVEFKERLQEIINEKTNPFGIEVSEVEIKDVELPDTWGAFKD